ncbi:MAG: hypothetical protein CMN30_09690 [Sandaracinus sp.]|nr:hypothetical protein [Sandaracinus sp.]|tara:strand:+ start:1240 stop:1539 length:300 start_codon:yes stop_codon:yes gene_type:complete
MRTLAVLGLIGFASVAYADAVTTPDCVSVRKSADYRGYGYTHAIHVTNSCDEAIRCTASADSAPDPIRFEVRAGQAVDKTLKIGAPGSSFELTLRCEKR